MSCDHELANEWACCSGKNASYITISKLCVFNTAYIGLFDRSLLHMSLNQVELALKNATLRPSSDAVNRMLMRENKGFFSFAFDSAHVKYGV